MSRIPEDLTYYAYRSSLLQDTAMAPSRRPSIAVVAIPDAAVDPADDDLRLMDFLEEFSPCGPSGCEWSPTTLMRRMPTSIPPTDQIPVAPHYDHAENAAAVSQDDLRNKMFTSVLSTRKRSMSHGRIIPQQPPASLGVNAVLQNSPTSTRQPALLRPAQADKVQLVKQEPSPPPSPRLSEASLKSISRTLSASSLLSSNNSSVSAQVSANANATSPYPPRTASKQPNLQPRLLSEPADEHHDSAGILRSHHSRTYISSRRSQESSPEVRSPSSAVSAPPVAPEKPPAIATSRNGLSLDIDRLSAASAVPSLSHSDSQSSNDDDDGHNALRRFQKFGGNNLTFTITERPTLYELLQPFVPMRVDIDNEYGAFQNMAGWFMGCKDDTLSTYAYWKPAARFLQFGLGRLLHVPKVDSHMTIISPKLRRSIVLVASMQYRCHFCAAHAASLGELAKGSWRAQVTARFLKKGGGGVADERPVTDPGDPRNSGKEAALLRLVTAASRIPSKVTPELKMKVLESYGADGLQMAAEMVTLFGWTNAITDAVGMELEANFISFAEKQIGPAGWKAGRHAPPTYSESKGFSKFEQNFADTQEVRPKTGIRRLGDLASLMRQVMIADKQAAKWASTIPASQSSIEAWLVKHIGFAPAYISVLRNLEAKRAVCFMLWLFLLRHAETDPCVEDEQCEWSSGTKALLFYVYSTIVGNQLLRGHAAHLALRRKVPITVLFKAANGEPFNNERLDAALAFVRRTATLRRVHTAVDNKALVSSVNSPRGVMELVSSVGLFNGLHRLSAMCAPEPVVFEDYLKEPLGVVGDYLGIDVNDASPCRGDKAGDSDPLQFIYF